MTFRTMSRVTTSQQETSEVQNRTATRDPVVLPGVFRHPDAQIDRLLTDKEGAAMLAMSRPTFRRHVRNGLIPPPIKLGFLSRWSEAELRTIIETAKAAR